MLDRKYDNSRDTLTYTASGIQWDTDGEDPKTLGLPEEMDVEVPADVVDMGDEVVEEYISDFITDETGFCHNGFSY